MIAKLERTLSNVKKKHGTNTEPHNGNNNEQRINNNGAAAFLVICTEKQYSENVRQQYQVEKLIQVSASTLCQIRPKTS